MNFPLSGFTKLEAEDMAFLMSLEPTLVKVALLLMSHRKLKNPEVSIEMIAEVCGVSKRWVYKIIPRLNFAEIRQNGLVYLSPKSEQSFTTECTNVHKKVNNRSQMRVEKAVLDVSNGTPKEVERSKEKELNPLLNTHYVGEGLEETSKTQAPKPVTPFSQPTLSGAIVNNDPLSANQTTSSEIYPAAAKLDPLAQFRESDAGRFLLKILEARPGNIGANLPKAEGLLLKYDLETLKTIYQWCSQTAEYNPAGRFLAFGSPNQALPQDLITKLHAAASNKPKPAPAYNPNPGDFAELRGVRYEINHVMGSSFIQTIAVTCPNGEPDEFYTSQCKIIPRAEITPEPYTPATYQGAA